MSKIISNIKERVLYFAENKEDSKQIFFRKVGLKYSNFTGKSKESDLASGAVAEILLIYPEINPEWLLTGKGEMLRENATAISQESAPVPAQFVGGLSTKDQRIIELQEKQIALLEDKVKGLEKENSNLENEIAGLKNKRTPPVKGNHKSTTVKDIHPDRLEGTMERTPEKELK